MAAIGAAVAPAALLLIYVVARDGGRSSAALIGLALSFGAIAGVPAGALSMSLDASGAFGTISNIYMQGFIRALLFAAAPEELAKFLMLVGIVARHEDCLRPTDILVGSIAIALGFAVLEGCFYIVGSDDWSQTAITRAASATPGHFFNGVLMGVLASGMANLGHAGRIIWPA
jgi:RsiW-degrading membrane proteinase PrsW (M82 family)